MSKKLTTKEFIKRAREVHGDKYDYSKVEYKSNRIKVCIICPIHGEFWQRPNEHINSKQNCPKCSHGSILKTKEEFIKGAKNVHGNKYDYSKVEYKGNKVKVCVICPIHGEFFIIPNAHLRGVGCKQCGINSRIDKRKKSIEQFIKEAKEIHR